MIPEPVIRKHAWRLCAVALAAMPVGGTTEVWAGKYGEVIVSADNQHWIGDLCYMQERFGWTHTEYMQAYGYTGGETNATRGLNVHSFGDKYILVVSTGSDGVGPLGLGVDTGGISFVSTDKTRIEAAARACREYLLQERVSP